MHPSFDDTSLGLGKVRGLKFARIFDELKV